MDGVCKTEGVVYKAEVKEKNGQCKIYVAYTEDTFKSRQKNHKSSFSIKSHINSTGHVWELMENNNKNPNVKCSILSRANNYSNCSDVCRQYQEEILGIITYKDEKELLNERSEVMSGCRHDEKYI